MWSRSIKIVVLVLAVVVVVLETLYKTFANTGYVRFVFCKFVLDGAIVTILVGEIT